MIFSTNITHAPTRHLHQFQTLGFCSFKQAWSMDKSKKLGKSNKVNLRRQRIVLGIVSKNYKTRKLLLIPCMYRYTFSFTLKLATKLLQKLAKFYMHIVKQRDDGLNQYTLHGCYGDYVTTN